MPKAPLDGDGRKYKDIQLDQARAKYWLGVGAQPSDPMWRILAMVRGARRPRVRLRTTIGGPQILFADGSAFRRA